MIPIPLSGAAFNDCAPTKPEIQFFADIAHGMSFVLQARFGQWKIYDLGTVGYRSQVRSLDLAKTTSLSGWNMPQLLARYNRDIDFPNAQLVCWRYWAERCITVRLRGVARLGADF